MRKYGSYVLRLSVFLWRSLLSEDFKANFVRDFFCLLSLPTLDNRVEMKKCDLIWFNDLKIISLILCTCLSNTGYSRVEMRKCDFLDHTRFLTKFLLILLEKQEKLKRSCKNYLYLGILSSVFWKEKNILYVFPFLTLQVHKQSAENKVKVDKTTTSEKPRQLYWEKRLSGDYLIIFEKIKKKIHVKIILILWILGLRPSYPKESFEPFELPKNFKPIGPGVVDDIALASITTSLHMNSGAIVGQKTTKVSKNYCFKLNRRVLRWDLGSTGIHWGTMGSKEVQQRFLMGLVEFFWTFWIAKEFQTHWTSKVSFWYVGSI